MWCILFCPSLNSRAPLHNYLGVRFSSHLDFAWLAIGRPETEKGISSLNIQYNALIALADKKTLFSVDAVTRLKGLCKSCLFWWDTKWLYKILSLGHTNTSLWFIQVVKEWKRARHLGVQHRAGRYRENLPKCMTVTNIILPVPVNLACKKRENRHFGLAVLLPP